MFRFETRDAPRVADFLCAHSEREPRIADHLRPAHRWPQRPDQSPVARLGLSPACAVSPRRRSKALRPAMRRPRRRSRDDTPQIDIGGQLHQLGTFEHAAHFDAAVTGLRRGPWSGNTSAQPARSSSRPSTLNVDTSAAASCRGPSTVALNFSSRPSVRGNDASPCSSIEPESRVTSKFTPDSDHGPRPVIASRKLTDRVANVKAPRRQLIERERLVAVRQRALAEQLDAALLGADQADLRRFEREASRGEPRVANRVSTDRSRRCRASRPRARACRRVCARSPGRTRAPARTTAAAR